MPGGDVSEPREIDALREQLAALRAERDELEERLAALELDRRTFLERYLEVEEENHNLANLYVASAQLHEALDLTRALATVVEVMANLVGAERFAVHLLDETTQRLEPVARHGLAESELEAPRLGEGPLGRAVEAGEVAFGEAGSAPLVTIPLRSGERALGAIALYALLPHKRGVSRLDRELFALLGCHAGHAIRSARLTEAAGDEDRS